METLKLSCILLCVFLPLPSDCAPRFIATPLDSGGIINFYVLANASFVTLVWDYNPDGETVKYVELYTYNFSTNNDVLMARKPPNQPLQVFENSSYSGRVTFSGRATFTISNITQSENYAYFKCQVSFYSRDYRQRPIRSGLYLVLVVPPTITYRTPSPVVINESDSTTLACVVRGNPFPAITWRNESGIVQKGYSWQYLTNYTIGSATKDHAGIYTCTANIDASGVGSFSTAYNVSVIVRHKPQVTLSGNQTVDEGRDAFIYCKAVAYPTPVKYNWFKNGKQIISDPNGDFVIDSLADGRSRLTVKQVRYEDRYNQTYRCSAANVMGTGKRKSFYFFVNYAPRQVTVSTSPSPPVAALDQRITLQCRSDGSPYPSFYWRWNGRILDGVGRWGTLVLSNAKVKDAGNYTCEARNRLGFEQSSATVVNVEYQPTVTTFTTGTPGNSVVQGATVNLTCSANGYPSPKYTIRHGVKTLVQESRTGRHVINNIQLNAEDESYFCVPSNKEGSGPTKELQITVQVPPAFPAQTLPIFKQRKIEDESVSYSCTSEAKPAAKILWTLNGQSLANIPPYSISSQILPIPRSELMRTIGYLVIDKLTREQTGKFSCIAINDAGRAIQSTELEVPSSLTKPSKESGQKENQKAGLSTGEVSGIFIAILFLLTIILVLIAYVMWLKTQGKINRNRFENEPEHKNEPDLCAYVNKVLKMAQSSGLTPGYNKADGGKIEA